VQLAARALGGGDEPESEFSMSVGSDAEDDRDADPQTQPGASQAAAPVADSGSADPPTAAPVLGDSYHVYQGGTFRKKTHANVNAAHSIGDIRECQVSERRPSFRICT
jgi:hypothetical protein